MWLTYGIDDQGSLVAVDDAPRGKTDLHCPYCSGQLTAKKGQVVQHHFAHTGDTCRAVDRADDAIALPLYDQFHLQLSGKELKLLRQLWAVYGTESVRIPPTVQRLADRLEAWGVLAWNRYQRRGRGGYEITKLGKIPVGALSLRLFTEVQEPRLHEKHAQLELAVEATARELEQRARERSAAIAAGMDAARQQGIHVGRPAGAESIETFLSRPTSQRVVAVLREQPDLSIRKAAQVAGVSINTVRKVAAAVGHIFD